ncbi:MAG: PA14 domain-containing protein [Caldilineaceae bacterium]
MTKLARQRDLSILIAGVVLTVAGSWAIRETPTDWVWPWLILTAGALIGGIGLKRVDGWLPDAAPPARPVKNAPSRRRRVFAWGGVTLAVGVSGWAAWLLWQDAAAWTTAIRWWLAALGLLITSGAVLRAVGRGDHFVRPGLRNENNTPKPSRFPLRWEIVLFLLILMLGVGLRLYRLDEIPAAIYVDETNASLDALYILEGRAASPFGTGWYETPNGYIYYLAGLYKLFGASYWTLKAASLIPALLTIPAIYALGRMLFGPLAGLAAMFVLSVSRWHMTLSRWGWNELMPPLFQIVGTFLLIRGLRERRATDFVIGGIVSGLTLYTYLSSRLVLLTLLLFAIYWVGAPAIERGLSGLGRIIREKIRPNPLNPPDPRSSSIAGLLLFGLAAMVAMTPLGLTYLKDPFLFFNRSAEISIFADVREEGSWWPLRENVWRHVGMFYQEGDPVGRQNLPGEPQTDPVTGALLAVGLAGATLSLRDRRRGLLWIWFVVAMSAGFLSELRVQYPNAPDYFVSPNAYRTLSAAVAIALTVGSVVDVLARGTALLRSKYEEDFTTESTEGIMPSVLSVVIPLLLLSFIGLWEVTTYFGRQTDSLDVQLSFNQMETQVAHQVIDALAEDAAVYLSPNFYNFSPLRFLVYGAVRDQVTQNPLDAPPYQLARPEVDLPIPANPSGALLLLDTQYSAVTGVVTSLYPNAKISVQRGPGQTPLFLRVWIPADDLRVQQGLALTIQGRDGNTETRVVRDLASPTDIAAQRLTWEGSLRLDESGVFDFAAGGGTLEIDDAAWTGPRYMGRGRHAFRLTVDDPSAADVVDLEWRTPSGTAYPEPVPVSVLFVTKPEPYGLTGYYYANQNWEGAPIFRQNTPFLLLAWPREEPLPHPFSASFRGSLRVSTPGLYNFRLNADDGVRFMLAGQTLGEALTPDRPNQITAAIELTPGLYPIRIDYFQRLGGSALEFYWQPPGQAEAPVPPEMLIPEE